MPIRPAPCRHAVFFYRDAATVRHRVTAYVTEALRAGRPALVIARPELRQQLVIALHRMHVQGVPFSAQRGEFVTLDAQSVLDRLSGNGRFDTGAFRELAGDLLHRLAGGGRVAAYGEMVGLLCERGLYADAIAVEGLWNGLLAEVDATLHCAYPASLFDNAEAAPYLAGIRGAHDTVREETAAGCGWA